MGLESGGSIHERQQEFHEPSSAETSESGKSQAAATDKLPAGSGESSAAKPALGALKSYENFPQAEHLKSITDKAVTLGQVEAKRLGISPASAEQQIHSAIETARTVENLGKQHFTQIGDIVFSFKWDQHDLTILHTGEELGAGSFGVAIAVRDIATQQMPQVLKYATLDPDKYERAVASIHNEYDILHTIGHARGVQSLPHEVIPMQMEGEETVGILTVPYDFDLESENFIELPYEQRQTACADLLSGLKSAHAAGVSHRDIKPANCCSKEGELQIADWGDAIRLAEVDVTRPLGVTSPFYRSEADAHQNLVLWAKDVLNKVATGEEEDSFEAVKALNILMMPHFEDASVIPPEFDAQQLQEAKEFVAASIQGLDPDDLAGYRIFTECYENELAALEAADAAPGEAAAESTAAVTPGEVDISGTSPDDASAAPAGALEGLDINEDDAGPAPPGAFDGLDAPALPIDLSRFILDEAGNERLKADAQALCQRHDVFSMAITLIELLSGVDKRALVEENEDIETSDIYIEMLSKLDQHNAPLSDYLYKEVIQADKRPTAEEFYEKYLELTQPPPEVKLAA